MTGDLPFYNYLGDIEFMAPYPVSFGDWSPSIDESVDAEQQLLVDKISHILRKTPTASHVRARNSNLTLEVGFNDQSKVIARKIISYSEDRVNDERRIQKHRSESRLLKWLANHPDIPVPRILFPVDDQNCDFIIMDKLPGTMLLNTYATFNTAAKEQLVQSFAYIALALFRLEVPQRIGTFIPGISSQGHDVIPRIAMQTFQATRVFEDIKKYLDFLFEMKKNSPFIGANDGGHIDELKLYVDELLAELLSTTATSALLRCVLVHDDLNDTNILVDKGGRITGVVDWEYQTLQPAILAADYPPWLSYDGCCDPRFADPKQTLWLDSPEESKRLRDLYLQIVQSKDHEYWDALVQGARLRSCVKWLLDCSRDLECRRMKMWMDATFGESHCA